MICLASEVHRRIVSYQPFFAIVVVVALTVAQPCLGQSILITDTTAFGWPNGRTGANDPSSTVDGNQSTYTWTTASYNTLEANLGLDFGASQLLSRIRMWKDPDAGNQAHTSMPKDLTVMYTTDIGPMSSRTWTPVSGMVNGFEGGELLVADNVSPDGTVSGDIHDSVDLSDGWASLVFDSVDATGVCIRFNKPVGTTYPYIHYKVHEFEAYSFESVPAANNSWGQIKARFR